MVVILPVGGRTAAVAGIFHHRLQSGTERRLSEYFV